MPVKHHQSPSDAECACYLTEESLALDLAHLLHDGELPYQFSHIAKEFDYSSGRTDLLGKTTKGEIVAFETKLTDWRTALHQARRSESFAHFNFVVLPTRCGGLPLKHRELFRQHGVGLILLNGVSCSVAIPARRKSPLLPWLTKQAETFLADEHSTAV
jgi:hypothetical protein